MEDLILDAEAWLEPLGYSQYYRDASRRAVAFTKAPGSPVIECWEDRSGTRSCRLVWGGLKLFMHLSSGDMQYRHPDIARRISAMEHYIALCEGNPPF